jgi:hypothetical protein
MRTEEELREQLGEVKTLIQLRNVIMDDWEDLVKTYPMYAHDESTPEENAQMFLDELDGLDVSFLKEEYVVAREYMIEHGGESQNRQDSLVRFSANDEHVAQGEARRYCAEAKQKAVGRLQNNLTSTATPAPVSKAVSDENLRSAAVQKQDDTITPKHQNTNTPRL